MAKKIPLGQQIERAEVDVQAALKTECEKFGILEKARERFRSEQVEPAETALKKAKAADDKTATQEAEAHLKAVTGQFNKNNEPNLRAAHADYVIALKRRQAAEKDLRKLKNKR